MINVSLTRINRLFGGCVEMARQKKNWEHTQQEQNIPLEPIRQKRQLGGFQKENGWKANDDENDCVDSLKKIVVANNLLTSSSLKL